MSTALASIARARVDRIKVGVEAVWHLVMESYQARDWEALGYATWDEMCTREFGTCRLRLPREDRAEVVGSLRDAGLSLRAIAAATGLNHQTVANDLSKNRQLPKPDPAPIIDRATGEVLDAWDDGEPLTQEECEALDAAIADAEPEPESKITGLDGKQYAPRPRATPAAPRTDVVLVVSTVLSRASQAARAAEGIKPEHLRGRSEQAAIWSRDLSGHMQALQRLLNLMEEAK